MTEKMVVSTPTMMAMPGLNEALLWLKPGGGAGVLYVEAISWSWFALQEATRKKERQRQGQKNSLIIRN